MFSIAQILRNFSNKDTEDSYLQYPYCFTSYPNLPGFSHRI